MSKNKKGQVWIETVIYTLIAFVLIGTVLTFAKPKIEAIKDQTVLKRSLTMLKEIDEVIRDIEIPGNKRKIEIEINQGTLKIDGAGNRIIFEMESNYEYSEIDEPVTDGAVTILTESLGDKANVKMTLDYTGEKDITYDEEDILKSFSKASTTYTFFFTNMGDNKINTEVG